MHGAAEVPKDSGQVQLVGVYRLPASLVFDAQCAGLAVDALIGEFTARVTLPGLEAGQIIDRVCPPNIEHVPADVLSGMVAHRSSTQSAVPAWGDVLLGSPNGSALRIVVSDIVIEYEMLDADTFDVENVSGGRRLIGDMTLSADFFGKIDPWFADVAGWLSVLVEQPVDLGGRVQTHVTEGEGLVVVARYSAEFTEPALVGWTGIVHRDVELIDRKAWTLAVELGSGGGPPLEHQLVAEARAACAAENHRLAVIQAATAVEVTLTERFQNDIRALGSAIATSLAGERRTLGSLVSAMRVPYGLPDGLTEFVKLRNRVTHRYEIPSRAEAEHAVRTAKQVLDMLAPIESYLSPPR